MLPLTLWIFEESGNTPIFTFAVASSPTKGLSHNLVCHVALDVRPMEHEYKAMGGLLFFSLRWQCVKFCRAVFVTPPQKKAVSP